MSIGTSNRLAMRSVRASTEAVIRRATLRSSACRPSAPADVVLMPFQGRHRPGGEGGERDAGRLEPYGRCRRRG
jgi:hypothetical protein